jgi:putative exosortase-associated protein (TIGR04073 family)
MKKISVILSIALLATFAGISNLSAQEQKTGCPLQEPPAAVEASGDEKSSNNNFYNMGRGLTNVATCWMEVFRCMIYRNSQAPFWGFVAGTVEGAGMTAVRAFTGVTDLLFLGFEPGNIFEPRFAEFVWESPWLPSPELQYKPAKLRQD